MPPRLHIDGRMSCQRKHTGVMFSAQESGHTVNREMLSLRTEVSQTEIDGQPVIPGQFDLQPIQRRVVLAPQQTSSSGSRSRIRLPTPTEAKRTDALTLLRISMLLRAPSRIRFRISSGEASLTFSRTDFFSASG